MPSKNNRPSGAQREKHRRARDAAAARAALYPHKIGDSVRTINNKAQTGTVEGVEDDGTMIPILVIRTTADGYLVRFNANQVEANA